MSWLCYALGGGLGHLTRQVALARQAARAGVSCTVISNSPLAAHVVMRAREPVTFELIDPALDAAGVRRAVHGLLERIAHDTLVVDTFPRGLAGELAEVIGRTPARTVLVHRDLSPRYVADRGLARFVERYDRVLLPGERGPLADTPGALYTEPWLVRDAEELWSRERARELLNAGDRPLVVISASGTAEEIRELGELARLLDGRGATVRIASPLPLAGRIEHWPLFELVQGIDLLIGSGGYNGVHEARAAGVPFAAFARPRRYDRQDRRLRENEKARDEEDLVARIQALGHEPREPPRYVNGAASAAAALVSSDPFPEAWRLPAT